MKVNMKKLVKMLEPERRPKLYNPYKSLVVKGTCFALCLALFGAETVFNSMLSNDNVSADELYDVSATNPSFIVQHVGNVMMVDIQPGEGDLPVLTDGGGNYHASVREDGVAEMSSKRMNLYEDYTASWLKTNSIVGASFLNEDDGSSAEGYILKEVWFGRDRNSENQSDFLVATVSEADGHADLSHIKLTNNPECMGLSVAEGGYYIPDENGDYLICIHNGDVVRLVFDSVLSCKQADVSVFDYDVSDGGYYKSKDYFHKGKQKSTYGQQSEKGAIYMDAVGQGIHSFENYPGYVSGNDMDNGPRLAFGGSGIGTDLEDECLDDELDTINVRNYEGGNNKYGVMRGLASDIRSDGSLIWSDKILAPDLFGGSDVIGKTSYTDGEYGFTFDQNGFNRMLSGVVSGYGNGINGFASLDAGFWILDDAPSYGTDGHDIIWGSGSDNTLYYRTGDRAAKPLPMSGDGLDHNSFFGFSYTEDFILSPGYTGALDIFCCSDDDMWVFAAQVDDDGQVMTDTVVQAADLGGIHDKVGYYCNLWNVIDRIPYGDEPEHWRLFVFWLERDGTSADCYLNFTLPERAIVNERETGFVTVMAINHRTAAEEDRTFVFDADTDDRYQGTYGDGTSVVIVPGREFTVPNGSLITISGLPDRLPFSVKEVKAAHVWSSTGDVYEKSDTVHGIVNKNPWLTFLSAEESGILSISADGSGTPEGQYKFHITLDGAKLMEIPAMDGHNNPMSSRFTDKSGQLDITLSAGETIVLCNLPSGMPFTVEPETAAGWHISDILSNTKDVTFKDTILSGTLGDSALNIIYRYAEDEKKYPDIVLEQSVNSNWSSERISLDVPSLLSYRITVTNPNDTVMTAVIEDTVPEGLEIVPSSLMEGTRQDGQTISWDVVIEPYQTMELFFSCQVTSEEIKEFNNTAWIIEDEYTVCSSTTVTAVIP